MSDANIVLVWLQ